MEPSHKDAETAAAAAAVAAAERGASSSSGVVVQVREKKGPLRAAIPYMPFPVAVICLFLNTFVPGLVEAAMASPGLLLRESFPGFRTGTLSFLLLLPPSTGTFVSAFTVLCGARTDLPDRHVCCVFWLNIAAALIQILTAIVMVGWIMSIFWGMDMVILASPCIVTCSVYLIRPKLLTHMEHVLTGPLPFSPHPTLLLCPTPDKTICRWSACARESKPTCKGSIIAAVEMVLWAEITPSNSGVCMSQEHYTEESHHNELS
ncbi:hypothetical protein MJT46_010621 [Ovis ammon polii x Ovis aries]|nr:hypothetical protein MJT46_010621 [Ovis ammon polii x Ovis aries]